MQGHGVSLVRAEKFHGRGDYLKASPRLSINVLRDGLGRRRQRASTEANVWIVVLDGMRWDTWQRVVRPQLLETFELKEEKAYLSLLPTWTAVARTGLLAGQAPPHWRGYRGTYTGDQALLTARSLGIPEDEQRSKLRFFSRVESDQTAHRFDGAKRVPYNVLVFNISDDNIHHLKGSLDTVNQIVAQLLHEILDMLQSVVAAEDTVILASDHGFAELEPEGGVIITDEARWQRQAEGGRHPVSYRYITGMDPPGDLGNALTFEYRGMPEGKFTVAIGRHWFQRADVRGDPPRYAHGGLSFAEMVVPGAVLQRITEKRIEVSLLDLPGPLSVEEGQELRFAVTLANTGNQPAAYELTYRADTDSDTRLVTGRLEVGERATVALSARPVYREAGGGTRGIQLRLSFGAVGRPMAATPLRVVPLEVRPQKGKVEISYGGLDDLE